MIQQSLNKRYEVVRTVRNLKKAPTIFPGVVYKEADLTHADGWLDAMEGVDTIFHVASPLGGQNPDDEKLIDIAVAGVENVFHAAHEAGVKRIIMTSSQAACTPLRSMTGEIDETLWTSESNHEINAYRKSKLFAEKKAWELAEKYQIRLTTILPGSIFGPALTENRSSNAVLENIKKQKAVPSITLEVSDVRDLAALHLLALENSQTCGERLIAKNGDLTFAEIGQIYGTHPITLPDFALRIAARFVPPIRALTPMLGRRYTHTNKKAIGFGWQPRPAEETIKSV